MYRPMLMTILALGLFAGCDRESPAPPSQPTTPAASKAADEAVMDAKADADAKLAAEKKAAADAQADADAKVTAAAKAATDAARDAETKVDKAAKSATDNVAAAASDADTAKATSLLAQVTEYLKDNKLDLAEKALNQLDGMKGSLPKAIQDQIDAAHSALKAKKAASMIPS